MQFHQLINILRRLFGRKPALARCPVAKSRRLPLVALVAVMFAARISVASVLVTGDVTPTDNPFTPLPADEGLPGTGNSVNPFEAPNLQTYFEGRHVDNNLADPNDDNNVLIPTIIVGQTASGQLLIDGESALRDQDLVIGDSGTRGGQLRRGTGVVRITGFGSLYNNDPTIIPAGLPANFASKTPRPTDVGYDLYVGRAGNGTLYISAGGRAEIQDAVIIGNDTGSTGNLVVDGFDSFLGSGGFSTGSLTSDLHAMIIGNLGTGFLTISNGGSVQTDAQAALLADVVVAASIGSEPYQTGEPITSGGVGIATVTGTASKWILNGSLQVGGFNQGVDGATLDVEGDNATYNSAAGRGTLYVQNGALVNVNAPLGSSILDNTDIVLAIGRFGRVILSEAGVINVGGTQVTGGSNPNESRGDNFKVVNDGIIQGSGTIYTGVFRNRYLGEVRVGPGEHLLIDSASEFTQNGMDDPPLANWGIMQALGTQDQKAELEIERALGDTQNPQQPFLNLRITRPAGAPIGDFYGGLISGQWSTLRFRSGLFNQGMMAFTAGNNYVTGNVVNAAGPIATPADGGIITVSGPNTKVTFEEDLINAGVINLSGGATIEVLARHSFVTAGDLRMTLTPTSSNKIFSAGDGGIDGKLSLSLSGFAPGSLHIGDSFEIINVTGALGGVDFTDPNYPKVDLMSAPGFDLVSFPSLTALGLPGTAALVPVYTSHSVLVTVATFAAATGPDFNGDGVVNGLDLNVWLANVGLTSGASVTQGDADGDGDVDGDDFLFWQRNFGQPMPWTGSGSGSGSSLSGAVPEPTCLALLTLGTLFSLAYRPRRKVS